MEVLKNTKNEWLFFNTIRIFLNIRNVLSSWFFIFFAILFETYLSYLLSTEKLTFDKVTQDAYVCLRGMAACGKTKNCDPESQIRETLGNTSRDYLEWPGKPCPWTFNMKLFHSYLVHGAWGCSHRIGFHFYFLTCFFIWRRGSRMIIRGNLIKGLGNFLGDLILVLILIFKAGNNECIVFLSIPKNKKNLNLEVTSTKQEISIKTI